MATGDRLESKRAEQKAYWNKRAIARMSRSEKLGNEAILRTSKIYQDALKNINDMVESIYRNYSKNVGNITVLDTAKLKQALDPQFRKQFLAEVTKKAMQLGLDPKKIFDERYLFRLSRLEALKTQIQLEAYATAPRNVAIAEQSFTEILQDTYKYFNADITNAAIKPAFSYLDPEMTDVILRSEWVGGNYSTRIWTNTDVLAEKLPAIIGSAINSGASVQRTSALLRQQFDVSKYAAARIIRTETAYMNNHAQAQAFVDNGVETYTLDVTMDNRTSDICTKIEEEKKIYKVSEMSVGENFPPLHPHCRTVPVANYDDATEDKPKTLKERSDRFEKLVPTNKEIQKERATSIQENITGVKKPTLPTPKATKPSKVKSSTQVNGIDYGDYRKFGEEWKQNLNKVMSVVPSRAVPDFLGTGAEWKRATDRTLDRHASAWGGVSVQADVLRVDKDALSAKQVAEYKASRLYPGDERFAQMKMIPMIATGSKPIYEAVAINIREYKTPADWTKKRESINESYQKRNNRPYYFNTSGEMVIAHEFGHVYDRRNYGASGRQWGDIVSNWRKEDKSAILDSETESFAEAFADYHMNAGKNLPVYVKEFFSKLK